ncbi:MAG TPA: YceI family protein [Mucilaginibacter sp.]
MKFLKILVLTAFLFVNGSYVNAQSNYSLCSYLATIKGTSNFNAWKERIEKIFGSGEVRKNLDKSFTLQVFKIVMQVNSIKCDEYPILNSSTRKALKADKFPEITFILDEPIANICCGLSPYSIMASGRLTIAGVTREVTMPMKITFSEDKKMMIDGTYEVKMTDYGIAPPSVLWGIVKAKDLITISFTTTFLANNRIIASN